MDETTHAGTKLAHLIAASAFAFILLLPVSQGSLLLATFGIMAVSSITAMMSTRRKLTLPVTAILWIVGLFGLYGLLVGSSNPGLSNAAGIYIGAPLLFFVCITTLGEASIRVLLTTCAVCTIILGVYIVIYVGGQLGAIPQVIPSWLLTITGSGFGMEGDVNRIRSFSLSTLAAAAPMWLASLFVRRDALLPTKWVRVFAAVAGISGAILGGRRAIILVLVVIPIIGWVVQRSTRAKKQGPVRVPPALFLGSFAAIVVGAVALPSVLASPILTNTWQSVLSFFNGTADASADQSIRAVQVEHLLAAWQESPFIGHGFGAVLGDGYSRSADQPWLFEMQYESLLMQTGLVGVVIIAVLVVFVIQAVRKAAKERPDLNPTLVVTLCCGAAMLIANATNPYLQAPAHMWAIFLPLGVINFMIRDPAIPSVTAPQLPTRYRTAGSRLLKA